MENLVPNGEFKTLPETIQTQTVGLRWINGFPGGSYSDTTYGWYFHDQSLHASTACFGRLREHNGGGSLTIANTSATGKCSANTIRFAVKPNSVYRLSAFVKTVGVPENGAFARAVIYSGATGNGYTQASTNKVSGDNDCAELSRTFTTDQYGRYMTIELHNSIAGQPSSATYHDVILTELVHEAPAPANTPVQFGVNSPFDILGQSWTVPQLERYCDKVLGFGGQWVRASFVYHYIHPSGSTGGYQYGLYDTFVQTIRGKGLKVLPILGYDSSKVGTPEFTDYFMNIAQHFSQFGIRYYELWNEKNLVTMWNGNNNPATYATLIQAAYPALKAGDPQCKVLFSGVTGGTVGQTTGNEYSPSDFLQGVYDAGGGNSFDIMNYHPYGHVEYAIQSILETMKLNGDETKPLWFTEDGVPTGGRSGQYFVTEAEQATYLVAGIELAKKYNAGVHLFYNGNDSLPSQPDREGYFGLTKGPLDNMVDKPSYSAVRDVILRG